MSECWPSAQAEALARGFINKTVIKPENICCTDISAERKEVFRCLKCNPVDSNAEVRRLRPAH